MSSFDNDEKRIQKQLAEDEELARNLQAMIEGSEAVDVAGSNNNDVGNPTQMFPSSSSSSPNNVASFPPPPPPHTDDDDDCRRCLEPEASASRSEIEEQLLIESEIVIHHQKQQKQKQGTERGLTDDDGLLVDNDEEMARKLEQTFMDEAMAERVQAQEEAARQAELDNRVQAELLQADKGCCSRRRFYGTIVPVVLAIIMTSILFGVLFNSSANSTGGSIPPFFSDNWGGNGGNGDPGKFSRWHNDGAGLELTIVNKLDMEWHEFFDRAVRDWDNGNPDALALTTYVQSDDNNNDNDGKCNPEQGKIVVCNGNYGRTGWTGLNEVYFVGPYIIQSVAKMNEDYLKRANYALRQYVMCHEIGHGFGLPHRNEDPLNPDLGSCLDYTIRPENNARPDRVDFQNLQSLYGTIGAGRRIRRTEEEEDGPYLSVNASYPSKMMEGNGRTYYPLLMIHSDYHDYKTDAQLLHKSGNIEVYERYLKGSNHGERVVTHVLLAT